MAPHAIIHNSLIMSIIREVLVSINVVNMIEYYTPYYLYNHSNLAIIDR